jgi:hypothetical protein
MNNRRVNRDCLGWEPAGGKGQKEKAKEGVNIIEVLYTHV